MKKFELNKVYGMNSICDSDCWWYYRVEARTNSTVTLRQLKSDGTEYSETIKCKINAKRSEIYGAEAVRPLGTYSMCPTLTAEKVIENLGEMAKLNKAFREAYDEYYQNRDEGDYEEMYAAGCQMIDDKEMHPLLSEFARYRHDYITSDREVAAFAKAYTKIYHPEPKAKVVNMGALIIGGVKVCEFSHHEI